MAVNEYFVDTSAFIALIYEGDRYHDEAVLIYEELDREGMRKITTDYVLTEVYAFLINRVGRFAADLFDEVLQEEENLTIVFQGEEGFYQAQRLFRQYSDKDYSLVDCASFVTMMEREITQVFAFDEHFWHYQYSKLESFCTPTMRNMYADIPMPAIITMTAPSTIRLDNAALNFPNNIFHVSNLKISEIEKMSTTTICGKNDITLCIIDHTCGMIAWAEYTPMLRKINAVKNIKTKVLCIFGITLLSKAGQI